METEKKTTKKKAAAPRAPRAKKGKEEAETPVQNVEQTAAPEVSQKSGSFIGALGRRKSAIARVRVIKNGKGLFTVNGKQMETYFPTFELRNMVSGPLKVSGQETAVDVSSEVEGGGLRGQAEAVRLGISRALIVLNPTFRKTLKKLGYLTRDPRSKERKKPGLKRARRAPQWSKR
ncbi:MAG TPA: 30S ribosomal protein S9 [Patescibacteria group bacterium]|nr:30S ribosomal protein S9 [Patescibacteria group bacterium]